MQHCCNLNNNMQNVTANHQWQNTVKFANLPSLLVCKYSKARTMTGNAALEVASVDVQWKEIEISCTVAIMIFSDISDNECAIV